jgi:hypothetical protein
MGSNSVRPSSIVSCARALLVGRAGSDQLDFAWRKEVEAFHSGQSERRSCRSSRTRQSARDRVARWPEVAVALPTDGDTARSENSYRCFSIGP